MGSWSEPVCMNREAGSWAGTSVHIERMTHMSSTQLAELREDLADLDAATCPCFSNLNGDG